MFWLRNIKIILFNYAVLSGGQLYRLTLIANIVYAVPKCSTKAIGIAINYDESTRFFDR